MKKKALITALVIAALTLSACGKPAETTVNAATVETTTTTAATTTQSDETTAASTGLSDDDCRAELAPLLVGLDEVDRIAASAISSDSEVVIKREVDGWEYTKVTDERFTSLADIDAFLNTYLTKNLRNANYSYIMDSVDCTYIESDGALFMLNGGRGCGFDWTSTPAEISDKTESSFTALVECDQFGEKDYIRLGIAKTADGWRIDTFAYAE